MKFHVLLIVKVIWLLLATSIFFLTLDIYDGTASTRDAELILIYGMIVLSFPASQLIALAIGLFGHLATAMGMNMAISNNYLTLTIEWIIFLSSGYLQWFVLFPWLWRRWKKRRAGTSTSSH